MRFERPQTLIALAAILFIAPLLLLPLAWAEDPAGVWIKQDAGAHRVLAQVWLEERAGVLASVKGAGVWFAPASGGWYDANAGLPIRRRDGLSVASLLTLPDAAPAIIALTSAGEFYRSWDDGLYWEQAAAPAEEPLRGQLAAARDGALYLATPSNVYISRDVGRSWRVAGVLPAGVSPSCIVADLLGPESILVGTEAGRIIISKDGGRSWTQPEMYLARGRVQAIVGEPAGALFAATSFGLLRSNDGGESWHSASPDLQGKDVRALIVDDGQPMTLYAGLGRGGVWRSVDGGENWEALGRGLTRRSVTGLAFDALGRALYVGAQDGVWRCMLEKLSAAPAPPTAGSSVTVAPTLTAPAPTATASVTSTPTATRLATPTSSPSATSTPTRRPTDTPTGTSTATPAPMRTRTRPPATTSAPTLTPSPEPTATPAATLSPTREPRPTQEATPPR